MEATRKAELEKRVVLIGGGILAALVFFGPMRQAMFPNHRAALSSRQSSAGGSPGPLDAIRHRYDVPEPVVPAHVLSTERTPEEVMQASYTGESLRDPLKSLLPPEVVETPKRVPQDAALAQKPHVALPSSLDVEGLIWGGREPKAIINHSVYGVGDEIQGAKIISIDRRSVMVELDGETASFVPSAHPGPKGTGSSGTSRRVGSGHP